MVGSNAVTLLSEITLDNYVEQPCVQPNTIILSFQIAVPVKHIDIPNERTAAHFIGPQELQPVINLII